MVIIGMMQNDLDKIIDEAVEISSNNRKYILDRDGSKKNNSAKKLKISGKVKIALAIGIIIVCVSIYNNIKDISGSEISSTEQTVTNQVVQEANTSEILRSNSNSVNTYINKYCSIYGLKPDAVSNIFNQHREHFNTISYFKNSDLYNTELEILTFIRHLYQSPSTFNVDKDSIVDTNFNLNEEIHEEKLVKYYSDLFKIDPVLVLAIEYQETTSNEQRYASDVYNIYNNPAGLIDPSTECYWAFPSKESGIIEHIYQLKRYYIDEGLTTPEQIKEKYSPDRANNDPNNFNTYWLSNVKSLIEEIKNTPNIFNGDNITYRN